MTKRDRQNSIVNSATVAVGLNAAIVAIRDETPRILTVRHPDTDTSGAEPEDALPFGPFEPLTHRTLEIGLREWVTEQTRLQLGYVEQLYTFGDRGRHASEADGGVQVVSIGYLALTQLPETATARDTVWMSWYEYFPWEDWRNGKPEIIERKVQPLLRGWAKEEPKGSERERRMDRINLCFGSDGLAWDEEKVLERYELLYEAGLTLEAQRDRPRLHAGKAKSISSPLGRMMLHDHRRIVATAMGRLRSKIKYRPVIFELMPPTFTLLELQRSVEAISGGPLHKQNFRRLLEKSGLVEGTGQLSTLTGGRPAELFRFRHEVLRERPAPGVRLPSPRRSRASTP